MGPVALKIGRLCADAEVNERLPDPTDTATGREVDDHPPRNLMKPRKLRPRKPGHLSPREVRLYRRRIESGFYLRPAVRRAVARRMLRNRPSDSGVGTDEG